MTKGRVEEQWGDHNEVYMRKIMQNCINKSAQHSAAGYHFKSKNTYWGLPAVLIPTIMAPVSVLIDSNPEVGKYVNAGAFLLTGIISGVSSFFKFGEKMTDHFNFEARYDDIVSDIELELVKSKEFRMQLDVFSTRIHMRADNLASTEPVIPQHILNDPQYNESSGISYQAVAQLDHGINKAEACV